MTSSKIIEVMARGLCRLRIQSNLRYDYKGRSAEWMQVAEDSGWAAFMEEAEAALTAYESHLQAEGMAVVPVEPTQEMIEAGLDHVTRGDIWRAMLAASPYGKAVVKERDDE